MLWHARLVVRWLTPQGPLSRLRGREHTVFAAPSVNHTAAARRTRILTISNSPSPTFSTGSKKRVKSKVASRRSPLHWVGFDASELFRCGDAWRRLGRQVEVELLHQELLVCVQLGIAAQDQCAAIGSGGVDVEYLDGGELVEHGAWGEAGRQWLEPCAQRDVKAIGQEGDEDM